MPKNFPPPKLIAANVSKTFIHPTPWKSSDRAIHLSHVGPYRRRKISACMDHYEEERVYASLNKHKSTDAKGGLRREGGEEEGGRKSCVFAGTIGNGTTHRTCTRAQERLCISVYITLHNSWGCHRRERRIMVPY